MVATDVTAEHLVEATRALLPLVRQFGPRAERERRLRRAVARALAEAGICRMLAPRAVGGLEIDPVTQLEVLYELSRADGSTGWVAQVYSSVSHLAGFLPPDVGREIYGRNPNAIVSGTLAAPHGRAVAVEGGYCVTGRWPYASGCQGADWLAATAAVHDHKGPGLDRTGAPAQRIVIFPASVATIHDTWHAGGLRGTGSHDVEVADVFVPAGWTFWWTDRPYFEAPLYVARWWLLGHGAQRLGMARAALDALAELAQLQFAQAEALFESARLFLWDTAERLWQRARGGKQLTPRQQATARLANTYAAQVAVQVVDLMYGAAGGSAVYQGSPLEQLFRDIHVAAQHAAVAQPTYEQLGHILLHPEPESLPRPPGPPLF
jgi:indole-3-acetate monooxygenase